MNNKIEQVIDEIEEYINNCKYKFRSEEVILVRKEELIEMLNELRDRIPEEVTQCAKMLQNREAIYNDAKQRAQKLLDNVAEQTTELISEHQIMQEAYVQANEIVELATKQAQEILDSATIEANTVRSSAIQYMDNMLENFGHLLNQTIELTTKDYNEMVSHLRDIDSVVSANRAELVPAATDEEQAADDGSGKLEVI